MFSVVPISKSIADEFIVKKHYSKRAPIFWAGFGLVENNKLVGVVVYGQPSPAIQKFAFENRDFKLYELSRLVIQTKSKNAASYLVANSLKLLDAPCAVVSFADTEQSHCGIVYQATNWMYTGSTISHDKMYIVDGKRVHAMTLRDKGITSPTSWAKENGVEMVKPMPKHRYFQFVGNKKQIHNMKKKLKYLPVDKYPKCNQNRYDDGEDINMILDIEQPMF